MWGWGVGALSVMVRGLLRYGAVDNDAISTQDLEIDNYVSSSSTLITGFVFF